ncbi:MAG TPA: NACHT domain-containing protein [Streptosporangiaceae bacterium]|nr:NACHT domain-containing protein [Streptosporangiaceae bacterium]
MDSGASIEPKDLHSFMAVVGAVPSPALDRIIKAIERLACMLFRRYLWRRALKRYQESIRRECAKLENSLPIGQGGTWEEQRVSLLQAHVPVAAVDPDTGTLIDVYTALHSCPRAVITGPPGSGKTTLLRYSMLMWAEERPKNDKRVPVLLKLYMYDGEPTIEDYIARQLGEEGFPEPAKFTQLALRRGRLTVLFDGLDEVPEPTRESLIKKIKGFAHNVGYGQCRILVTCRSAVYDGQFYGEIATKYELAEFDDGRVAQFLSKWPGLTINSREQLFTILRRTPRLSAIVRNPRLLTMVAYLCGKPAEQDPLPGSRPEFYERVAMALLKEQSYLQTCTYDIAVKREIIEHLAVIAMEDGPRKLKHREVVETVAGQLPQLGLAGTDVRPLLEEIVYRSGLLVKLDGGQYYRFADQALLEFFAAHKLANDPALVESNYLKRPASWREIVRLWCASAKSSGRLIRAVDRKDRALALACMADAREVDPDVAMPIIDFHQRSLGRMRLSAEQTRVLVPSFGAVAAAPGKIGDEVFGFLLAAARSGHGSRRQAVWDALAATGRPAAAAELARLSDAWPEARAPLIAMGELAVPALTERAHRGSLTAVDDLASIGTPAAVGSLVTLLADGTGATRTAWRLAELLGTREVTEAIRRTHARFPADQILDWVWTPFRQDDEDPLTSIVGRVAWLIQTSAEQDIPATRGSVDPRIALPLCAVEISARFRAGRDEIDNVSATSDHVMLKRTGVSPAVTRLFESLDGAVRQRLLTWLLRRHAPGIDPDDWQQIFARDQHHPLAGGPDQRTSQLGGSVVQLAAHRLRRQRAPADLLRELLELSERALHRRTSVIVA